MDAVVSIHQGEFSLKNGQPGSTNTTGAKQGPYDNRNNAARKANTLTTDTSKGESTGRQPKGTISQFESPTKGPRQFYNKTQPMDDKTAMMPQSRPLANNAAFNKWADNEVATSPKFNANQITFVPTKKTAVQRGKFTGCQTSDLTSNNRNKTQKSN